MVQAEIENHIEISDRFLRHAEEEFELRDLPQASEKAWGAVAHYLKSVAKSREWRNHTHRDLYDISFDLAQETNDPARIMELFTFAEGLHVNFYEDRWMDQTVAQGIRNAQELISRLENRSRLQVNPRPSQVDRTRRRRRRRRN